jgi:hypothetical protein
MCLRELHGKNIASGERHLDAAVIVGVHGAMNERLNTDFTDATDPVAAKVRSAWVVTSPGAGYGSHENICERVVAELLSPDIIGLAKPAGLQAAEKLLSLPFGGRPRLQPRH